MGSSSGRRRAGSSPVGPRPEPRTPLPRSTGRPDRPGPLDVRRGDGPSLEGVLGRREDGSDGRMAARVRLVARAVPGRLGRDAAALPVGCSHPLGRVRRAAPATQPAGLARKEFDLVRWPLVADLALGGTRPLVEPAQEPLHAGELQLPGGNESRVRVLGSIAARLMIREIVAHAAHSLAPRDPATGPDHPMIVLA